MRSRLLPRGLFAVALLTAACALMPPAAAGRSPKVVSRVVTFSVQNVDRSRLACPTDGASYQISGHLTGPQSALAASSRKRKRAAALYLHGLGFGDWFWNFAAVPGYNYAAAQAKAGHVSVTIDRLGYAASGHPDGNKSCIGGQADIAHQVIQALRKGTYSVAGGKAVRFTRIALAGHSAGAEIAMLEAYSFNDVNALVDMSFSFANLPRAQIALGPTQATCSAGGEPAGPGAPSGYAFYGQPAAADFESIMFHSAKAPVRAAADLLRNRDPCGETTSIVAAILQQRASVKKIRVPVLVICGTKDALYAGFACKLQADRFTGSRSVTTKLVKGAGHALTLEAQAASFRRKASRWLAKRGF